MKNKKRKGRPTERGLPWFRKLELMLKSRRLLHRDNACAQTRFVARGGVLVQRALLDRLVESGNGLAVHLLSSSLVALGDGLAQVSQLRAQGGGVGAVARRTAFGLAGALHRRKMICHVWFVTFVSSERYSGGSELLIIGVQRSTGQTLARKERRKPPRTRSCTKEGHFVFLCAPSCP